MSESGVEKRVRIKAQVAKIVAIAVTDIIEKMFGRAIRVDPNHNALDGDAVSVQVLLFQQDELVRFRFAFDRQLLASLIADFYPGLTPDQTGPIEDSACEIANIVCNRIKAYLNEQGFHMVMHLPVVERDAAALSADVINLRFSLGDNAMMVNFQFGPGQKSQAAG